MPHKDQSKEQAFALWLAGATIHTIEQQTTAKPETIVTWVREWERGRQRLWNPQLRRS